MYGDQDYYPGDDYRDDMGDHDGRNDNFAAGAAQEPMWRTQAEIPFGERGHTYPSSLTRGPGSRPSKD